MRIQVKSPAFGEGELIPQKYTCLGENVSPPLSWERGPGGTVSYVLISDDPDAVGGNWVHWVVYNIPSEITGFSENMPDDAVLDDGTRQGITDFGRPGYGGPCPPSNTHRYYFKIYALDSMISLPSGTRKEGLEKAMEGHVLAEGRLMGRYKKN